MSVFCILCINQDPRTSPCFDSVWLGLICLIYVSTVTQQWLGVMTLPIGMESVQKESTFSVTWLTLPVNKPVNMLVQNKTFISVFLILRINILDIYYIPIWLVSTFDQTPRGCQSMTKFLISANTHCFFLLIRWARECCKSECPARYRVPPCIPRMGLISWNVYPLKLKFDGNFVLLSTWV